MAWNPSLQAMFGHLMDVEASVLLLMALSSADMEILHLGNH